MGPEEEIIRAGEAAQVLDSRIFKEASQRIRDGIHDQMMAVPLSESTMHTRLVVALQLWGQLERYLEQVKQSGDLAAFQIEQDAKKRRFWQVG